jgi:hypothetical protein
LRLTGSEITVPVRYQEEAAVFRSLSGFKAQYQSLTLVAVSEFDEWKVLIYGPDVTIHGARQFGEAKAKEHALAMALLYYREVKQEAVPDPAPALEWVPTGPANWLIGR